MKRFAVAMMISGGALLGGGALANAQEYPPTPTTTTVAATTTTLAGGVPSPTTTQVPTGVIPATGSSGSGPTLTIAAVFLTAGVGLYLVSMARRRQAIA